jgi:hypothetical protein
MKLLIAAICIALVASVPVADVPANKVEIPAEIAAPAPAVEAPAAPAVEAPAAVAEVEVPAVAEAPAAEAPAAAVAAVEATTATAAEAVVEAKAEEPAQVAAPQVEEVLKQVVNLVQSMTGGLSEQDSKSLKDMMNMGADVLSQAEKKAQEIQAKIQDQNLLQADNMFGIKEDGSIDAGQAVDQISNLINIFVGPNTVNDEEKKMMKSMLTMVTSIINPPAAGANSNPASSIAPMAHEFEGILRALMTPPTAGKHDDLLHPEALLDMFGSDDKTEVDFNAIADVANKFIDSLTAKEEIKA